MKLILTDIDDTIVHWSKHFREWVVQQGFVTAGENPTEYDLSKWLNLNHEKTIDLITEFNTCESFEFITTHTDALEVINRLKRDGYNFIAISAANEHTVTWEMRKRNLDYYFPKVFDVIYHTGFSSSTSKRDFLNKFKNCYWVEDSLKNANLAEGDKMTFLIDRPWNQGKINNTVHRVKDWYEIERYIKERPL